MQSGPYTIRAARAGDLASLPAIERAAATLFHTTAYAHLAESDPVSAKLDLDREHVWVAFDGDDIPVAFAIVTILGVTHIHLHELDVHPQHARCGLGRRLIETVAGWARRRGARALTLTTFADVPWNGPYYARLGFRKLDPAELSPELESIVDAEAAAGLPVQSRICMQLDL